MSNVIDFMKYKNINDVEKLHKDIWECAKDTMDEDSKWLEENCPEYSLDTSSYVLDTYTGIVERDE